MRTLQVVDQAVDTRRVKRISTHQKRLNGKRLAKLLAGEMTRHHLPNGLVISQANEPGNLAHHGQEGIKRLRGQLGETHVVNTLGVGEEGAVAIAVSRLDTGNFFKRFFQSASVVKVVSIGKMKPIPRLQRHEVDMFGETLTKKGEKLLKQKWSSNNRRPGIMAKATFFKNLTPPA